MENFFALNDWYNHRFLSDLFKQSEHSEFSIRNAGDIINTISFIDDTVEIQIYLNTRIADNVLFKLYSHHE